MTKNVDTILVKATLFNNNYEVRGHLLILEVEIKLKSSCCILKCNYVAFATFQGQEIAKGQGCHITGELL